MKSTAQIAGHPIHPMLIPYPFAFLSSAVVFDVVARMSGRKPLARTAAHLTAAGLGTAVLAAVPGIVDYFGSVPPGTKARRTATQHALFNVSALVCFALASSRREKDGHLPGSGLSLSLLGTGLLSAAGWLGGELVYHQHVAVSEEPATAALPISPS